MTERDLPTPAELQSARRADLEVLARRLGVQRPSRLPMPVLRVSAQRRLAEARRGGGS